MTFRQNAFISKIQIILLRGKLTIFNIQSKKGWKCHEKQLCGLFPLQHILKKVYFINVHPKIFYLSGYKQSMFYTFIEFTTKLYYILTQQ